MSAEAVAIAAIIAFLVNFLAIVIAIYKLGKAVGTFESIGKQQALEITTMKNEMHDFKDDMSDIKKVITDLAVQDQRLTNLSTRLGRQEQLVDDIRRGEGRILPLFQGANEVP